MKNFKKVLALVLVLATLLGLATMASATEYKDADKIAADYDEAIKVLDLIETMQGYPNGEFRPTANITREEAAKLIAIFDNKDADISTYYTSINPFADEKGRWGESYVGYGYRAGIIAGMNATTFAPTANVTGTQFLKMALVTLGYDQEAEGFVGSSWAVNVLALAKRIDLIDGLADGWKPEADLTRQEAAQILLNTLNAETVEYAQETKANLYEKDEKLFETIKDNEGNVISYRFNGKLYLTVAGAVQTGKKLYESFKLKNTESIDVFYRPYTKWTYDNDSDKTVEVMKAPKATFTTGFNACELLVALGVKETDTKTTKTVSEYYVNGVEQSVAGLADLHHGNSKCETMTAIKFGAQGTLTQVFKLEDGTYRVCSIDTWLAKVTKVDTSKTARDNHKKGDDNVELSVFTSYAKDSYQEKNYNYNEYCNANCASDSTNGFDGGVKEVVTATYDDPNGLAKNDYVLITYSWAYTNDDEEFDADDCGVQTVDVTEGKDGRLNGYKAANVAPNPSETRIDGEYVKDAVHFHLGYDASKTNEFGTKTFFYDAYGNVIGMKDAADTSSWLVVDKAFITYSDGDATLNAKVYDLDAKLNTTTVKKFDGIKDYLDDEITDFVDTDDLAYDVAVALYELTNGQSSKDFNAFYDHLFKASYDKDGKLTLKTSLTEDKELKNVSIAIGTHPYGLTSEEKTAAIQENFIKVTKGTPYLTYVENDAEPDEEDLSKDIVLTSKTQFLVHQMDGSYASYTGYKNVPSMIAHYAEVVYDADYKEEKVASVVYLTLDVYTTDGKFVAYVGKCADLNGLELKEDGEVYYGLTAYIDGEATDVYVTEDDMNEYFNEDKGFKAGFFQLQYTEVDGEKLVKVLKDNGELTGNNAYLNKTSAVIFANDEEIKTEDGTFALADDYKIFGIYENEVVTDVKIGDVEKDSEVWFAINDDDQITALYLYIEK